MVRRFALFKWSVKIMFSFESANFLSGPVVQLVSTPPCHGGGRGFEPLQGRFSDESPRFVGSKIK